jgi:PAS domain S-box-containing protein
MMRAGLSLIEYTEVVEQAPIMIWRANTSGECDYFNQRWLAFTGRSMEQELGNGWAEGVHPDDFEGCLSIYLSSFSERKTFEMEYRLRRSDGIYRWIFDRGVPYHSSDGTFLGYIGSCIDVTDRVEAQEALKKYHESEIEALRDILPICSYCKKIRDDAGYWQSVEQYFSRHSKKDFSHGLCPACYEKAIGELDDV